MKNNFHQNFNYFVSTTTFKVFFLLMLLMNLYVSSCITSKLSYFESLVMILVNYPYYYIVFILLIFSIVARSYKTFMENLPQVIRYKSYTSCIEYLLKQILFNVSICFILNILLLLISLNLFHFFKFDLLSKFNGINILFYSIFILCRFYIFCIIFSILNFVFLNLFNHKVLLLVNVLLSLLIRDFNYLFPPIPLNSMDGIPIFFFGFFGNIRFSSFSIEACVSAGHIFVLSILCFILYNYIIHKSKINFEISNK